MRQNGITEAIYKKVMSEINEMETVNDANSVYTAEQDNAMHRNTSTP